MCRKHALRIRDEFASLLLAASLAGCAYTSQAAIDEQPTAIAPASAESTSAPRHFAKITTLDGKTYEGVTVQKVQPDGLLVEFNLSGGGFGTAKLKFRNLPASVRDQYGYDPRQAEAFEAAQSEGQKVWAAENEAWRERREAALAEQTAREQELRDKARSDEAAAERARAEQQPPPPNYNPYGSGFWGSGGWYPVYPHNRHHHHVPHPNHGIPQQAPQQGLPPSVPPFMSPMRPLGR